MKVLFFNPILVNTVLSTVCRDNYIWP